MELFEGATLQFEFSFIMGLSILWLIVIKLMAWHASFSKVSPYGTYDGSNNNAATRKHTLLEAARQRKINFVKRAIVSMMNEGVMTSAVLLSLLRVLMTRKMNRECLDVYDLAQVHADTPVLRIMLASAVEVQDVVRAKDYFERIQGEANARDWYTRMRATKHLPDHSSDVLDLIDRMERSLCLPDLSIYIFVFNVCLQDCRPHDAERFLPHVPADVVYYNALMRAYSQIKCIDDAFRCFDLLKARFEPSHISYGTLLDACVTAKQMGRAKLFVNDMSTRGVVLNTVHQTTLIKGLCRANCMEDAIRMFRGMEAPDLVTYSTLIKALADCGRMTEALELLEKLEKAYHSKPEIGTTAGRVPRLAPDEIVYNSILFGCIPKGDVALAHSIFERMRAVSIRPSAATISTMLKLYVKTKYWDEAVAMLASLHKFGIAPETRLFRQVVLGLSRVRQGKRVIEVYNLLRMSLQKSSSSSSIPSPANGEILSTCIHFNLTETTKDLIYRMHETRQRIPSDVVLLAAHFFQRKPLRMSESTTEDLLQKLADMEDISAEPAHARSSENSLP